jgi:hypothetical protein
VLRRIPRPSEGAECARTSAQRRFGVECAGTSAHLHGLSTDDLGLEDRLAVFEEHGDNLGEVLLQLVNRLSLGVRARPAGHIAHVQPSLGNLVR